MDMRIDRLWLIMRLAECEAVYRTGRSQEELALLADIWAQDLEGQDREAVGREPRAPTEFQQRQQDSRKLARALLEAREAERTQTGGHHGHADRQALADHAPCRM